MNITTCIYLIGVNLYGNIYVFICSDAVGTLLFHRNNFLTIIMLNDNVDGDIRKVLHYYNVRRLCIHKYIDISIYMLV